MKYIDRIANIAVIVGVVVFLFLVFRGEFRKSKDLREPPSNLVGETVRLPGVQIPRDRDSLFLAVSTTCHFCEESMPFYKQIVDKSRGRINIVAVLPQPQQEAERYMQSRGVEANQVVSANLDAMGVRGTPTVLLVDGSGKVKHAWTGRLDEKGQKDLLEIVLPKAQS